MVKTPNPMILAARKRLAKQDPMKRRGRAYGLGERNPDTLPGSGTDAESVAYNQERSRYWSSLRRKVQSGSRVERHLP